MIPPLATCRHNTGTETLGDIERGDRGSFLDLLGPVFMVARLHICDGHSLHVFELKHRRKVVGASRTNANHTQR